MADKNQLYVSDLLHLVSEWEYEKNKELDPSTVTYKSKKRVWWKCEKGHSWIAAVYNRTNGSSCPYCSGKLPIVGVNDLKTLRPELASEWHPTKNGALTPEDVKEFSAKRVWWICKNGHEWETAISNRTSNDAGCPYCSNQKVWAGYNDLKTIHPEVAKEWHPTKNQPLRPSDVVAKSNRKVWWLCDVCATEWKTSVAIRANGSLCPTCGQQMRTDQLKEHWIEKLGTVDVTHPHLLNEWDYERNGELRPNTLTKGSRTAVWWICEKGHSWKTSVSTRAKGHGCPKCDREHHTSFPEKAVCFYLEKHFSDLQENVKFPWLRNSELDIFLPSISVGIEYDGQRWHKNPDKDNRKFQRCLDHGIRLIRLREPKCPEVNGEVIKVTAISYAALETAIKQLIGILGIAIDVDIMRDLIEIQDQIAYKEKQSSLASVFPDLAKEWHPTKNGRLLPTQVTPYTPKTVWWQGSCGHEWTAQISQRSGGYGCPICSGKRVVAGLNDLQTTHPNLAKEWHPTKNGNKTAQTLTYGSSKRVWWLCSECATEWKAAPKARSAGKGNCPECTKIAVRKNAIKMNAAKGNSLAEKFPDLAKEWHPTKNGEFTPDCVATYSNLKFWWICPEGHEYDASPLDRSYGSGCPYCSGRKHPQIKCVETGTIYQKYVDAEKDLGIKKGYVSRYFKGGLKSASGYHFVLINEEKED